MFSSAWRNASMEAASLPEKTTSKSRSRLLDDRLVELDVRRVGAQELALAAGLGGRESAAYLLRFSQSRMSGCSSASHGGTNQPMMPTLPCGPKSVACRHRSPAKNFFSRSG